MNQLECRVCGYKFNAIVERHYVARDNIKSDAAVAFSGEYEVKHYDAFDCPLCGSQIITQERKRDYISDEDDEVETDE